METGFQRPSLFKLNQITNQQNQTNYLSPAKTKQIAGVSNQNSLRSEEKANQPKNFSRIFFEYK